MAGDRRHDLLEVVEDRCGRAFTLIASQIAVAEWHAAIGEAALVDATGAGNSDEANKARHCQPVAAWRWLRERHHRLIEVSAIGPDSVKAEE